MPFKIFLFAALFLFWSLGQPVQAASSSMTFPCEPAQQQVFAYLKMKVGTAPTMPEYPPQSLIPWAVQRHRQEFKDEKSKYAVVGEDLLIAQKLLNDKSVQRQRQGMRLAQYSGFFISKLGDKWLHARVYEGFLLPYLSAAYIEWWQDLGRQRITEAAAAAFEKAGEKDKQVQALRLLLELQSDENTKDWARGKLAQILASQNCYLEAIDQLKAIQSPSMSNLKKLIPEYEKRLKEQPKPSKPDDKPKEK